MNLSDFWPSWICFLLTLWRIGCIQVPATWVTSPFVQADSKSIIITKTGSGASPIPSGTLLFPTAFAVPPHIAYGIINYEGSDEMGQEFFQVYRINLTLTFFQVRVQISGNTNIWLLTVRYIAIDRAFPHHLTAFDNVPVNYNNGALQNITVRSLSTLYYYNNVNYTNQSMSFGYPPKTFTPLISSFRILLFLTSAFIDGVNEVSGDPNRPLDLRPTATVKSSQFYMFNVSSRIWVKITRLRFSMVIFDYNDVVSSKKYALILNSSINLPKTGGFIPIPQQFINNLIIGFTQYSTLKTSSSLHFNLRFQFNPANLTDYGIYMPPSVPRYNNLAFSRFGYTLFYLMTWICPIDTFFDLSIRLCVSCPIANCIKCTYIDLCQICNSTGGFLLDTTAIPSKQCTLCPISNCITCASLTSCLECNNTNNYFLVTINSTGVCVICPVPFCLLCSSMSVCTVCDEVQNYFLNPSPTGATDQCIVCSIPYCLECSSLVTCVRCNQTANYFVNPSPAGASDQCIPCTIPWCIQCGSLSVCVQCDASSGYTVNQADGQCMLCPVPHCKQCQNQTLCAVCDQENNYFLNETVKSITITVNETILVNGTNSTNQTYITIQTSSTTNFTTQDCVLCTIPQCVVCFNLSVCQICFEDNNYFNNPAPTGVADQCILCDVPYCQLCSNLTACSFCNFTAGYFLNPFAVSNLDQCLPCTIWNCVQCQNLTSCLTCNQSFNFFPNASFTGLTDMCSLCVLNECIQCSSLFTCSICNNNNSYFINQTDLNCYFCNLSNCLECNTLTTCLICDNMNLYFLNTLTGLCQMPPPLCGDNIRIFPEECDDGNSRDGDGCSLFCLVEPDFVCEPNPTPFMFNSLCYYMGEITLRIVYIEKIDYFNQVLILLEISPAKMAFWDGVDFFAMVTLLAPVAFDSYTVTRNADSTVSLTINYSISINGMPLTVQVDPVKSGKVELSRQPLVEKKFDLVPSDNEALDFYDQDTYDKAQIISILSQVIAGLGLLLYIIGIFARKLIGVEVMAVIQVSFLSLVALSSVNPCFKALSNIWFVNGFNYFSLTKEHLIDPNTPIPVKGLQLYSYFIQNYNFTFVLFILLPLLLGFITFILSRTQLLSRWKTQKELVVLSKQLCCYTVFNGVMFSGYIIAVGLALEIKYGIISISGLIPILGVVMCSLSVLVYILYFILILAKPKHFGQFVYEFKKEEKYTSSTNSKPFLDLLSNRWYNILMAERMLVGACLVALREVEFSPVVTISIFLLLGLYCLIRKPYIKRRYNYRFALNMLVCIIIQAIYLLYRMNPQQNQSAWFIVPFIVCCLLLICIIYNIVFLCYDKFAKESEEQIEMQAKYMNNEIAKEVPSLFSFQHDKTSNNGLATQPSSQKYQCNQDRQVKTLRAYNNLKTELNQNKKISPYKEYENLLYEPSELDRRIQEASQSNDISSNQAMSNDNLNNIKILSEIQEQIQQTQFCLIVENQDRNTKMKLEIESKVNAIPEKKSRNRQFEKHEIQEVFNPFVDAYNMI